MATELAAAYVTLMPSLKGANASITKQLSGIDLGGVDKKLGGRISDGLTNAFDKATGVMKKAGKIGVASVLGVGTAIAGIAAQGGFSRALNMERANTIFKGLKMNAQDIDKAMAAANATVTGTAFGLDEAAKAAAMLSASGVGIDNIQESLQAIAGTASMAGTGMDDITDIFQRVAASGKLSGEELARLSDRGVAARQMLAQQMGITTDELNDMVKKGQIDFQTFSSAMYAAFGEAAYGANETFTGAMANTRAALARIGQKFAQPIMDAARNVFVALMPLINLINEKLAPVQEAFSKFASSTAQRVADAINTMTEALKSGKGPVDVLAAGFGKLVENTEFAEAIEKAGAAIGDFSDRASGFLQSSGIASFFMAIANAVQTAASSIANGVAPIKAIGDAIDSAFGTNVSSQVQAFFGFIADSFRAVADAVSTTASSIASGVAPIKAIGDAIDSAFGTNVSSQVQAVFGFIADNAGKLLVFGGAAAVAIAKFSAISGALTGFAGAARGAFTLVSGALGGIGSTLSLFHASIGQLLVSGKGVTTFFAGMPKYLLGMVNPVGAVVAVIAALVAGFIYLMSTNEGFRETIMGLVEQIGTSLAPILDTIATTIGILAATVLPAISAVIDALLPVIAQVLEIIFQVAAALAPLISLVVGIVLPTIAAIIGAAANLVAFLVGVLAPVFSALLGTVSTWVAGVSSLIQGVVNFIQGIISAGMALVQGDWDSAWQAMSDGITGIINGISQLVANFFTGIGDAIGGFAGLIGDAFGGLGETISGLFGGIIGSVDQQAPQMAASMTNATTGATDAAATAAENTNVGEKVTQSMTSTMDATAMNAPAIDMVKNGIEAAKSVDSSEIGKSFSDSAASGVDTSAIANKIASAAASMSQTATVSVKADLSGVNQLKSASGAVKSAYASMSGSIASSMSKASSSAAAAASKVSSAASSITRAIRSIPTSKKVSVSFSKPHIPVPHYSSSGSFNPKTGSFPSYSAWWGKEGGILTKATIFGAGEAGPEAVLPLTRLESMLDESNSKYMGGDVNVYLNYDASADAQQMARDIARDLKRYRMAGAF